MNGRIAPCLSHACHCRPVCHPCLCLNHNVLPPTSCLGRVGVHAAAQAKKMQKGCVGSSQEKKKNLGERGGGKGEGVGTGWWQGQAGEGVSCHGNACLCMQKAGGGVANDAHATKVGREVSVLGKCVGAERRMLEGKEDVPVSPLPRLPCLPCLFPGTRKGAGNVVARSPLA